MGRNHRARILRLDSALPQHTGPTISDLLARVRDDDARRYLEHCAEVLHDDPERRDVAAMWLYLGLSPTHRLGGDPSVADLLAVVDPPLLPWLD